MDQWFGLTEVAQGQGIDRGARWVAREGLEGHYRISGTSLVKVNSDSTVTVFRQHTRNKASIYCVFF